jgi:DNA-directed RNA polymerase specialized sigma24 family protein
MENHEETLKQLAIQAQQHPVQSTQRRLALNRLVSEIMRSPKLARPQQGNWPRHLYEDLYNEALQKTLLEICQKIDQYNPKYRVMAWVNELLRYRFLDVVRDYYRTRQTETRSLDQLDYDTLNINQTPPDDEAEKVAKFLTNDPENRFQIHIKSHPEATFQALALAKYVEGQTWEEISLRFNISMQTIISFVKRNLHKLNPYFRKYLQE